VSIVWVFQLLYLAVWQLNLLITQHGTHCMNEPTVQWQPVGYATVLQRMFALMVDSIVFLPFNLLSQYNLFYLKSYPLMVFIAVVWWLYKPLMEWRYGATLGKMVVKIRVLDDRMQGISLNQALLRFLPYFIISLSLLLSQFNLFYLEGFAEAKNIQDIQELSRQLSDGTLVVMAYFLFLFLVTPILYDEKNQALYDKLSQTYCIAVQPIAAEQPPQDDSYELDPDSLDD